jgi:DNA repair exonuclease SbcCD nuclease subunit
MNKIAIFTDLHLGVHQNSSFWINISIDWVKWFRDDLKKRDITQIIFCGDFFHFRDEVSLVSLDAAYKVLDILKDFKMYMITGNHDCYYKHSSEVNSLSIIKGRSNVEVYDEMTVLNIPGIKNKFVLCPWGTKLDDIPAADVVFGHFELENFNMNAHKICEHGDDVDKLVLKSPLIFSGHFHLRDEKRIHNSRVIYVGNPFQMDFGDAHQRKGYYILDADTLDYEFVENDTTPKHIKIYLSKLITSTNVDELFSELLPNNIIRSEEHTSELQSR